MVLALSDLWARVAAHRDDQSAVVTALAAVVVVASATAFAYRRRIDKPAELPSPESTLPVLGNTLDTMKYQRPRLYDWFTEQSLRHGGRPWQLRVVGRPRAIIATSPAIFEDTLRRQLDVFVKGELSNSLIRDFFGHGILAVDGDEWFFQRKTASHLFSLQMMRDVMCDVIREKIVALHDVLVDHTRTNSATAFSFRRAITHFTSDVFAKIGFGVELECLGRSLLTHDENEFVAAFEYCARIIQLRLQQPSWLWRLKRFLNVGDEKVYKDKLQVVDGLIFDIIDKSMRVKTVGDDTATTPSKDLISFFLDSKVNDTMASAWRSGTRPHAELAAIRDMVVNFIFAGMDTTSNSISWFIVMMNRYPHVAQKIRDELRAKLPTLMTGTLAVPTMDELAELTYLEAAIRENLRLNPPVAVTARTANAATTLSDGTPIRPGDRVVLATYAAARQPSVWGDDAAEFKPERWIDPATGSLVTVSPFKFSSFLAGPRICLGQKFAMLEMKTALAVLLARFDLETVQDPWAITYEIALTCPVSGPLMVHAKPLVQ